MTKNNDEMATQPVSRSRRASFVFAVVAFGLVTCAAFVGLSSAGVLIINTSLIKTYVETMLGLATAISLGYVGTSSIDYNGGIGNMLGLGNKDDKDKKG